MDQFADMSIGELYGEREGLAFELKLVRNGDTDAWSETDLQQAIIAIDAELLRRLSTW